MVPGYICTETYLSMKTECIELYKEIYARKLYDTISINYPNFNHPNTKMSWNNQY